MTNSEQQNDAYMLVNSEAIEASTPLKQNGSSGYFSSFPSSIKYLIWNEFCERFSFYGMKAILALYLRDNLWLSEDKSTEFVHLFIVACYATSLLGAFLSDCHWGKYRTVLYLSIVYCVGNGVMALSALPDPDPTTRNTQFWSTSAALGLIAIGTGGIKPCVAAFGGDQIQYSLADGPTKDRLQRQFFSMYYFAVNAGSVLSIILTPILRTDISYSVAFAVPAALMMGASLIFWAGRNTYIDRPPEGNVFAEVANVVVDAIKLRGREERPSHWLDNAKAKHSSALVEDVKGLVRVLVLLLPTPLFWSLFDQQASKWVFQASTLDGRVLWLFGIVIQPDQMQALNAVLILLMIPLFNSIIYPFLENRGYSLRAVPRMVIGMVLSAVAFLLSGLLQLAIDQRASTGGSLSILWQVPQYVVMTAGEIMFSITGLEFAYSQAPDSMKSVVQSAWLLTVATGNLTTVALVSIIGNRLSKADEFFIFAGGCVVALLLLSWAGSQFVYKHKVAAAPPFETLIGPEDRIHGG